MSWAGEVPQQLGGVPAACYFPEDASLLPNSHMEMLTVTWDSSSRKSCAGPYTLLHIPTHTHKYKYISMNK